MSPARNGERARPQTSETFSWTRYETLKTKTEHQRVISGDQRFPAMLEIGLPLGRLIPYFCELSIATFCKT
jgi:hypothetical protein